MKIIKKILASTLALLIVGTFSFGSNISKDVVETNVSYAASPIDEQREQLRLAVEDAKYVRGTQSYKNAARKDVDAYESAIGVGQGLLKKNSATGQELYQATKNIDSTAKYLPTSANIILIKTTIERNESKLSGLDYIEKKMPNTFSRYKTRIDAAKKSVRTAVANAKKYIAQYER